MNRKNGSIKISWIRLAAIAVQVALILFSSTRAASQACEYAYRYYRTLLGLGPTASGIGHILAQKGIHFLLFFSLATWLYYGLQLGRIQRLAWTAAICLLTAFSSEGLQFFMPGRNASLADVILNAASGVLATALLWRMGCSLDEPGPLLRL